jgi:cell division protein FtsQ
VTERLLADRGPAARVRRALAPPLDGNLPDPSPLPPLSEEHPSGGGRPPHVRRRHGPGRAGGADEAARSGARPAEIRPAEAVAPPGRRARIDPRIRQRRIQVTREAGHRRLRLLIVGTGVLIAVAAAFGVLHTPLTDVRHVRVTGASRTPVADVLTAAGLDGHRLMIDVDGGPMAARVDALPWVARAQVQRRWPATVTVTISERTPVATVAAGGGAVLVDGTGRVLAPAPAGLPLPAVQLDPGPPGPVPAATPGSVLDPRYRPGLDVAAALPPLLGSRVLTVAVEGDGTVRLRLVGGTVALLGDATDVPAKLEAVATLVQRVRLGAATIDATVPNEPVLTGGAQIATFSTQTGG